MSVSRSIKCDYDLKALALAATEEGFLTSINTYPYLYGTQVKCELVISSRQHRYSYGFYKNEQGNMEMIYDGDGKHLVNKDMAEKILPRYLEIANRQNGGRTRQHQRVDNGKFIELRYREA